MNRKSKTNRNRSKRHSFKMNMGSGTRQEAIDIAEEHTEKIKMAREKDNVNCRKINWPSSHPLRTGKKVTVYPLYRFETLELSRDTRKEYDLELSNISYFHLMDDAVHYHNTSLIRGPWKNSCHGSVFVPMAATGDARHPHAGMLHAIVQKPTYHAARAEFDEDGVDLSEHATKHEIWLLEPLKDEVTNRNGKLAIAHVCSNYNQGDFGGAKTGASADALENFLTQTEVVKVLNLYGYSDTPGTDPADMIDENNANAEMMTNVTAACGNLINTIKDNPVTQTALASQAGPLGKVAVEGVFEISKGLAAGEAKINKIRLDAINREMAQAGTAISETMAEATAIEKGMIDEMMSDLKDVLKQIEHEKTTLYKRIVLNLFGSTGKNGVMKIVSDDEFRANYDRGNDRVKGLKAFISETQAVTALESIEQQVNGFCNDKAAKLNTMITDMLRLKQTALKSGAVYIKQRWGYSGRMGYGFTGRSRTVSNHCKTLVKMMDAHTDWDYMRRQLSGICAVFFSRKERMSLEEAVLGELQIYGEEGWSGKNEERVRLFQGGKTLKKHSR